MAAEFTCGVQKADHIVPTPHTRNLITCHDGQLVGTTLVHFSKSVRQFRIEGAFISCSQLVSSPVRLLQLTN